MSVITQTGIRLIGLLQPMMNALGDRHKKAMTMPFTVAGRRRLDVATMNPTTTHGEKADRLASQVKC